MIRFAHWWILLLIPVVIALFIFTRKRQRLHFSSVKLLHRVGGVKTIKHKIGKAFVLCGLILALVALARPQTDIKNEFIQREGVDIAMILDVSGSMQSVDFEPNRLEVARASIDDFIVERANDRISLIVFAGSAFTRIPLTLDHEVVRQSLSEVTLASVNNDGTAIGMAISVGLNRLKKSASSSRIMILATDGENNAGEIDPMTAAGLSRDLGIRIYTIGVGTDETILPVQGFFGQTQYQRVEGGLDEELLKNIADITDGKYFRAKDKDALFQVFETINQLERTQFDDNGLKEYNELAFPLIGLALLLLVVGIFLDRYYFLQIP